MTGVRRAAIALMALDQVTASKLLATMPKECATQVSAEIHLLPRLSRAEMQEVEKQFLGEVAAVLCAWTKTTG